MTARTWEKINLCRSKKIKFCKYTAYISMLHILHKTLPCALVGRKCGYRKGFTINEEKISVHWKTIEYS